MDQKQPTRSKRVVAARRFDKTQLRASGHGRTVHRDYASHALRWSFVANDIAERTTDAYATIEEYVHPYLQKIFFRYGWVGKEIKQGMKILDVGCGQDQPLLYVLGARIQTVPELYVGVDLNRIMKKSSVRWARIHDEFDFVNNGQQLIDKYGPFDVVVNFEVIEHMGTEDGKVMLAKFFSALKPGGRLYLSTPVFDGQAAANHVHEYTIPELKAAIEEAGFTIANRYGTFASKYDITDAMNKAKDIEAIKMYNRLEKWFGGDALSVVMAPLYPDASRNNMWVCVKP